MVEITINDLCSGFGDSRIGGRSENQDSFGKDQTNRGGLVLVCDGMGGGPGGKTASQIAVNEIIQGVAEAETSETNSNALIKAIRRANMAIIQKGNDVPQLKGMGSTVVSILISKQSVTVAHVGDSRVYQIRKGAKIYRTFDHSMVFDLVKQKVITEEQARLSVQSNIITRALGIKPDVEVEVEERSYEAKDRFLLCTDGIHGTMPERELIKLVSSSKLSLGATIDNLVTKVDMSGRQKGGGHDNLTAVILEMKSNSILKEKMSKRIKNILLCLSAVLIISVIFNVVLITKKSTSNPRESIYANSTKLLARYSDSIEIFKDTITKRTSNDSITGLKLEKLTNQINSQNIQISKLKNKNEKSDSTIMILRTKVDKLSKYKDILSELSSQLAEWASSLKNKPTTSSLSKLNNAAKKMQYKINKSLNNSNNPQ